jgi:hypothetical protein
VSKWKLIETAKKVDRKTLWLYQDNRPFGDKYVFKGSWLKDRGWVSWDGGSAPFNVDPTHWQPFNKPKPPKEGKGQS